jgi:hypothetical protein
MWSSKWQTVNWKGSSWPVPRRAADPVPGAGRGHRLRTGARRPTAVRRSAEVGRGRPTYEETPRGVTTNAPANPSCETKPISCGRAAMGEGRQGRPPPLPLGQNVRNKANSPRSNVKGKYLATKALQHIGPAEGLGETKPICTGVSSLKGQVSSEQRPAAGPPSRPTSNFRRRNKANFRGRIGATGLEPSAIWRSPPVPLAQDRCLTRAVGCGLIPRTCWMPSNLHTGRAADASGEVYQYRRRPNA